MRRWNGSRSSSSKAPEILTYSDLIEVQTHNTDLKKRLSKFAVMCPDHCRQTDDDEQGDLTFEIEKGRLSFRLSASYSAGRRKIYSKNAKEKGMKGSAEYSFEIKKIV